MNSCSSVRERPVMLTEAAGEVLRPAGSGRDHRGRLLRGYLHKSSNSLCGIKGYASLIAGGAVGPGRSTSWARKIIAEVERLEDIYRSVRDMAFPEPGLDLGAGQLAPVVQDAARGAESRHANLTVLHGDFGPGRLLLPSGDLLQILAALLDNSAESCAGPVLATIEATEENGRLMLAVTDDGPGMAYDLLAQAMDPFVTTRDGHLGIGLARVDTILDMYGLGWGLRSIPGQGTTVTLEVAAASAAAARS
ncbi:MAG: HAMP domain-containing sensor histidine kinase [Candidatus Krumholzibacteriia bacterium]